MRPEDATHRDSGGNLYKAGEELNWLRWGNDEWFIHGTVSAGELRPLKDRPSAIRPEGATHISKVTSEYYKPKAIGEGWMRWGVGTGWYPVGDMNIETLQILPPVQVVQLEKFDAPMAPRASTACEDTYCIRERLIGSKFCLIHGAAPAPQLPKDPHGVYKVQLTRWQADDGSFHESYEDAVNHGHFKDLNALMLEFMDHGEIDSDAFIASLLEHYKLERKL